MMMASTKTKSKPNPFAAANAAKAAKRAGREAMTIDDDMPSRDRANSPRSFGPVPGLTRAEAAQRRAELKAKSASAPKALTIEDRMLNVLRQVGLIGEDGKAGRAYRGPPRMETRGEDRSPFGRVVAFNRTGQPVSRTQAAGSDKFHIEKADIPDGWDYNWKDASVIGKDFGNMNSYRANGWEPVLAARYPGRFMPESAGDVPIVIDGLMLMERPKALSLEAQNDDIQAAQELVRVRNDQFVPKGLPGARDRRYRGTGLTAKRDFERMPADIDPPSYELTPAYGIAN